MENQKSRQHRAATVRLHSFLDSNFAASQMGLDLGMFDARVLGMATMELGILFAFSNPDKARELCDYLNDINANKPEAAKSRERLLDKMAEVMSET